ncbi:MAG: HyaD/HybD family hydrogenase maturation endopeptidase [Proteobacteria bacterium]|nr:HyaD/HybD family hydrogenase maturation endopeptidase [Pseudomonadota bacterium]MCL2307930.1 HyaD/HybD family hydrogenase maturation endopeptidase [Pseudomonadota bacterium]
MKKILVLGVGNVLWADEGFGVRAVEALHAAYRFDEQVTLMDGGTQGLALYPYLMDSSHVLVFDAIEFRLPPTTLKVLRDTEVPVHCSIKISPHQTTLSEVLAHAYLLGAEPEKITVIGVQPERLDDFGGSLCEGVRKRIPEAVALAAEELASWGVSVVKREEGEAVTPLNAQALMLETYENERPSEAAACRIGDERVLSMRK